MANPFDDDSAASSHSSSHASTDSYESYCANISNERNNSHDLHDPYLEEKSPATWILTVAASLVLAAAVFCAAYPSEKEKNSHGNENDPDQGDEFAISSSYLREMHSARQGSVINSDNDWSGDASSYHATQNTLFDELIYQLADVAEETHAVTSTQATQVKHSREILDNIFNELELSIPISQALYSSGPTGPAMSWKFQLLTANPAVETTANTTQEMHANAKEHARLLNALVDEYGRIAGRLSSLAR